MYIIPEFDVWGSSKVIKNVPIIIEFSDKGWNKLLKYLEIELS